MRRSIRPDRRTGVDIGPDQSIGVAMGAALFAVTVLTPSIVVAVFVLWRTRSVLGEYVGRHRR